MTELWTNAEVANHFGVSESRARHILSDNGIKRVYGYPAAAVKAIQRPGQGARTDLKENAMTTTTQLYDFSTYSGTGTVRNAVVAYTGDFVADFDIDGLADAYRDAINANLVGVGAIGDSKIVLRGDTFYSAYPAPENSTELIEQAIEAVDLNDFAQGYDKS